MLAQGGIYNLILLSLQSFVFAKKTVSSQSKPAAEVDEVGHDPAEDSVRPVFKCHCPAQATAGG